MNDFSQRRLKMWIAALAILAIGIYAVYRYVQPPEHSEFTRKDLVEGLKRAGRAPTEGPPPSVNIPIDINRPVRLAIGSLGFEGDGQNESIQDLVLAQLSGAPGLELVERQSLERVLGELNLSMSGLVRAKDALRAGKLVKADWFLLGSPVKVAGTNSVVLRLVDARTGILRDAGVFSVDRPTMQIAGDLAAFVRDSRKNAASPEIHTFLAIGGFEDLSSNRRQAAFPKQLRSYLTAAYRGSGVTLLEREAVDTLLQEVRLDLAGLADGSETNVPQPMQSAYWLVDGAYQSYETTNSQVELVLKVWRIFGKHEQIALRGLPNEALFAQAKSIIDSEMKTNSFVVWRTGNGEARAQLALGKDLASKNGVDIMSLNGWYNLDANEFSRRRHNIGEAIRAFQTVLLLQPTNSEAKVYLASCLLTTGRTEEALNYCREVLEEPVQDGWWVWNLKSSLHYSFPGGPVEKVRWFETAARQATNTPSGEYFRHEAEQAEKELMSDNGGMPAQEFAEKELFKNIMENAVGHRQSWRLGADNFLQAYGTDKTAAARRLLELYPEMKAKSSNAAPFVLAAVLLAQTDTNAPVVAEFQEFLAKYTGGSNEVANSGNFWNQVYYPVCEWSFEHKLYGMAAETIEARMRYAKVDRYWRADDEMKLALAYADMGLQRWQKALDIFVTYSNRPIHVSGLAPWGSIVLTSKQTAFCRNKLGLPEVPNPMEFDMGEPVQCMCTPSTFIADNKGLWIGIEGQLLRLTFDLQTNFVVRLPISPSTPITSLALQSSKVWIGTGGEGLVEYDGTKCRRLTADDGLAVDSISCLQVSGDTLWIGYSRGLGFLNLKNGKVTSFIPSIAISLAANFPAPREAIRALAAGRPGEVWFSAEGYWANRFRANGGLWDSLPEVRGVWALAADENWLVVGHNGYWVDRDQPGAPGVTLVNFKDLKPHVLGPVDGLPASSVTTLTVDGQNVWVGGSGYVALVDMNHAKIRKYAYVKSRTVDRIQIGGGYVWAQFDWHLHRASLRNLK